MTKKHYTGCRLVIIMALSAAIAVSINAANYYLPLIFVITAMAGLHYCRKQLKTDDVMADERDYKIAGDAARYTITIYGGLGAIGTFVFMAVSDKSGWLYDLSQYSAYSVCFLMLLNAFLFKYLSNRGK
ncbi:MAG: DUF2178 domain-containing protein [Candidatus Falkowbacteria bacterium]